MSKISATTAADGWTRIDTPSGPVRYRTSAEADAYLAGLHNGLNIGKRLIENALNGVDDQRPIRPAPRGEG